MLEFTPAIQPIALLFERPTFSAPDSHIPELAPSAQIAIVAMA